jgi:hypothetical protein
MTAKGKLFSWLLEKITVETLEREGKLPEGSVQALMAYSIWQFTPTAVTSRLVASTQFGIGRIVAMAGIPGESSFKPGTYQKTPRTGLSKGTPVKPGAPTYGYRVGRIGGGPPMGVSIFAPGLALAVLGPVLQWQQQRIHDQMVIDAV